MEPCNRSKAVLKLEPELSLRDVAAGEVRRAPRREPQHLTSAPSSPPSGAFEVFDLEAYLASAEDIEVLTPESEDLEETFRGRDIDEDTEFDVDEELFEDELHGDGIGESLAMIEGEFLPRSQIESASHDVGSVAADGAEEDVFSPVSLMEASPALSALLRRRGGGASSC